MVGIVRLPSGVVSLPYMSGGSASQLDSSGVRPDPQEAALKSGRTPDESSWDAEPPDMYGKLTTPEGSRTIPTIPSSFTHYYENIRDAILGKAQLAVTPEQALNVMRGLELAVTS